MKLVVDYPAMIFDGRVESVGDIVEFVDSHWELHMDVKKNKDKDGWVVSFVYPNNDNPVVVSPGDILYKGEYGSYGVIPEKNLDQYPSARLEK